VTFILPTTAEGLSVDVFLGLLSVIRYSVYRSSFMKFLLDSGIVAKLSMKIRIFKNQNLSKKFWGCSFHVISNKSLPGFVYIFIILF
jgi:hypothetical protein